MANKKIRQAFPLSAELEDTLFDLLQDASELLETDAQLAANKTAEAWELVPEPKFNTSCSDMVLSDHITHLLIAGRHEEASSLAASWVADLEGCGYPIYITTAYLFSGESLLYLNKIEAAKNSFYTAVKHGANQRDFAGKPPLYFDIAKKIITDNALIATRFQSEVANAVREAQIPPAGELSDDLSDQIEELSEQGNEAYDDDNFGEAISIWQKALALIPAPQQSFGESLWLNASIGDAYFFQEKYKEAAEYLLAAKGNLAENGYANAFVMLRLGEVMLENGNTHDAKEYLLRAYMLEGENIFAEEEEKYFTFLKNNVELKKG